VNEAATMNVLVSPVLVPTVTDYYFDLTTGQGTVTTRALDGDFSFTSSGPAGTFSLVTNSYYAPYVIEGSNVPVTALEIGGVSISPGAGVFPTSWEVDTGFLLDPTQFGASENPPENEWAHLKGDPEGLHYNYGSSGTTMRKFPPDASCCALMSWQINQQGQTSPHGLQGSSV
jgi:hypothetical protein